MIKEYYTPNDAEMFAEDLTKANEKLAIAFECLNHYGNKSNWIFDIDGREEGKAAREALMKINDLA